MQRFTSQLLLRSRSINQRLGSLSFLISTFWWWRSPLAYGMSSRISTTNVFSVSRNSSFTISISLMFDLFRAISRIDWFYYRYRICVWIILSLVHIILPLRYELYWNDAFYLQLCYMPVVLSILPVLWFVWCWRWPQSFAFWVQSLSHACSSSISR